MQANLYDQPYRLCLEPRSGKCRCASHEYLWKSWHAAIDEAEAVSTAALTVLTVKLRWMRANIFDLVVALNVEASRSIMMVSYLRIYKAKINTWLMGFQANASKS